MEAFILSVVVAAIVVIVLLWVRLDREKNRSAALIQATAETIEKTTREYEGKSRTLEEQYRERNRMLEEEYQKRKRDADEELQSAIEGINKKEAKFKEDFAALEGLRKDDALIFAGIIAERVRAEESHLITPLAVTMDELEREFGYAAPGRALAEARKASRKLTKENNAAVCDAKNQRLRETAVNFIKTIFDEKVDSILKSMSANDYSRGSNDIRNTRDELNSVCRALFNATITKEYFNARQKELKALTAVLGMRERKKAEQQEIREQMREEAKARREYEKAIKEAEKQKAESEKAAAELQARVDAAVGEEKVKYESMLADLLRKNKELEEKQLRARALAEFTKRGHVYVISNIGSFGDDVLKIGMTRRLFPDERIDELGNASVPFPFDIHAMIESDDAPALEAELHRTFNEKRINKVNPRKEFFRATVLDIQDFLSKKSIDPVAVRFTMTAEARQYRESLSIDSMPVDQRDRILANVLKEDEKGIENRVDDADDDVEAD